MAMNREQRRYLQKQGQMDEEGNVIAQRRERNVSDGSERSSFKEYAQGVRSEMRKVTWPTKSEVVNYTIVVTITLILLTALVWALDLGFAESVNALLDWGTQ